MTEGTKSVGKTTIAPEVLLTIIRLTSTGCGWGRSVCTCTWKSGCFS